MNYSYDLSNLENEVTTTHVSTLNFKQKFDLVYTPWGSHQVLYEDDKCKIKRIIIKPGQRPSYQYHHKREECWQILQGTGRFKLDDSYGLIEDTCSTPDVIRVSKLCKHTIENIGTDDLIFIEIQTGEYFGEDDIVRIDDKYGRV